MDLQLLTWSFIFREKNSRIWSSHGPLVQDKYLRYCSQNYSSSFGKMRKKLGSKNKANSWAFGKFCDWPTYAWLHEHCQHFPRLIPSIHALYCQCGFKFVSTRLLAIMPWPPFPLQFASGKSHKGWLFQNALTYHWSTQICSPQTEAKSFKDAQSFLLDEVNLCARPKGQIELVHRSFSASLHFMDFSFHWVRNFSWQLKHLARHSLPCSAACSFYLSSPSLSKMTGSY